MLVTFWALLALALVGPLRWTVYLFFMAQAFGAFNTIAGSITLTPVAVTAPVLVLRIMLDALRRGDLAALMDGVLNWRRLGLLTGFVLVTLMATAASPALFAGASVIGLNTGQETGLAYSGTTLTQTIFLLASYATAVSIYMLMLDPRGRRLLAEGVLVGGVIFITTGVLDLLPGSAAFLASLRTATYSLLAGASIGDLPRVVGLSTEASAYGGGTLAYACFCLLLRPGEWLGGVWRGLGVLLGLILLGFTVLSTSSGAYLGMGFLALLWAGGLARGLLAAGHSENGGALALQAGAALVLVLAAVGVLVFMAPVRDFVSHAVDTILLSKGSSSSFSERSNWNHVSLRGLVETYGFGLGAGATRASSWPVALVAGGGVLGAGLMVGFILRSLTGNIPHDPMMARAMRGARACWLVLAVPAAGAGTSIDFGFANAVLFAVLAAAPLVGGTGPEWSGPSLVSRRRRG